MSENKKDKKAKMLDIPIDGDVVEAICPTERMIKQIREEKWPPVVKVDKDTEFQLTEMDVSWTFCTVLGMKWKDAQAVPEGDERLFLYAKSLMVADGMQKAAAEAEQYQKRAEEAMRKNIDSSIDDALANHPGTTIADLPPELPDFAKFNL